MNFREDDIGGTARCGRCAGILPDETLTFCPKCGVPFSRVPPTNNYTPLVEKREALERRRERWRSLSLILLGVLAVGSCLGLAQRVFREHALRETRAFPPLEFYTFEVGEFPRLSSVARRQAVAVAVQAFEDHFGFPLRDYTIHEDLLPEEVAPYFRGPWKGNEASGESPMLLSFWEKRLYPKLFREWHTNPGRPLKVLITNIPLFANAARDSELELRHLSGNGLVSGLGHPSFVVTTTYRMLTHDDEFARAGAGLKSEGDYARHLGEYILAHELGHALLGLSDYVVPADSPVPETPSLRAPASLRSPTAQTVPTPVADKILEADPIGNDCLMHTDEGGGFQAWKHLSHRTLGLPTPCRAYNVGLEAFALRSQSLAMLRAGHSEEAQRLHAQAIEKAEAGDLQDWVLERWHEEQTWFSGFPVFK